jgi:hypothetical protein
LGFASLRIGLPPQLLFISRETLRPFLGRLATNVSQYLLHLLEPIRYFPCPMLLIVPLWRRSQKSKMLFYSRCQTCQSLERIASPHAVHLSSYAAALVQETKPTRIEWIGLVKVPFAELT